MDATSQIGTGHFMRCLAFADALRQRGSHVRFISRQIPDRMREMVVRNGHQMSPLPQELCSEAVDELPHAQWLGTSQSADAKHTIQALAGKHVDWLIVDHYALDARWESALRRCAANILAIDDLADRSHDCDALLDQNLHDDMQARYSSRLPARCRLLLGPQYALLREEFREARASVRTRDGSVKRLLVLMGGADMGNLTGRAIDAISRLPASRNVDVVIGAQHPACDDIAEACKKHGYVLHVQPSNIAQLMAAADLAVGSGGSTNWERCCLGLPTLTLCAAANQKPLIEGSALNGLVYAPDVHPADTDAITAHLRAILGNPLLLQELSRNGMRAVDGRGTQRVMRAMGIVAITIRRAKQADSGRILAWRNHPEIRGASGSSDPIPAPVHEHWFSAVMADPERILLLGELDGEAVGAVRFDVADREAEVSIYVAPGLSGEGRGSELLQAAETWLTTNRTDVQVIRARVLQDNRRSHGLFEACDYQERSTIYTKKIGRT